MKDVVPFDFSSIGIPKDSIIVSFSWNKHKNKRISDFINHLPTFLTTEKEVHFVVIRKSLPTDAKGLEQV